MKRLAVLGGGSWGTALAIALASRFEQIRLWARDADRAADMQGHRENPRYLPGFRFPANLLICHDIGFVPEEAELVLCAIPSTYLRSVLLTANPYVPRSAVIVSATKGIEEGSLCRMSQVIAAVLGDLQIAVLSGPTFAKEIAAGEPAAVVIASKSADTARAAQQALATSALRLYTSADVIGVEIGAALKNVIAIASGVCHGLGLGSNSAAALIARGLAEITRLAVAMGGNSRTLSGLAGLGDLVLTATGDLSRNRYVGLQIGKGRKLADVLGSMQMVAEGVTTCRATHQLGIVQKVELPITAKMYEILYDGKDPRLAIRELMERPLTNE